MKRVAASGLVLLLAILAVRCRPGESRPSDGSAERPLAFVGVHVVPMTSEQILRSHTVLIEGDRIVQVGPDDSVRIPGGAQVVRAHGRYLVPGLADLHVHLRAENELDGYLRHGVTMVAALRGTETVLGIREKIGAGAIMGPRILTAGPLIDGERPIWSGAGTQVVTTIEEARDAGEEHCRGDYELLKVYNNLHPDVLDAIADRAHGCGLPVFAHLPRTPIRREGLTRI